MMITFSYIKEFIEIRDTCVFCGRKLKCVLTSFGIGPHNLPIIDAPLLNDKFNFSFNYTGSSWQINAQCIVDTATNISTLELIAENDSHTTATNYIVAKTVLEGFFPHIELYCSSKKCKLKYILHSDTFKLDKIGNENMVFKIRPFSVYMESLEVDKFWIQNDWINNSLNIYSRNNMEAAPIKHSPILDLSKMGKEKVVNRIHTLVTFN